MTSETIHEWTDDKTRGRYRLNKESTGYRLYQWSEYGGPPDACVRFGTDITELVRAGIKAGVADGSIPVPLEPAPSPFPSTFLKLLAMAVDGATMGERETARNMAQAYMKRHGLSLADVLSRNPPTPEPMTARDMRAGQAMGGFRVNRKGA